MAKEVTGALSTVEPGMGADPTASKEYIDAINKQLAALEGRQTPNLMQIASAFMNPGRTGNFGEALGNAMGVIGKQQEEQEARAPAIAQMRAALVGKKFQLEQQEQARQIGLKMLQDDQVEPQPEKASVTQLPQISMPGLHSAVRMVESGGNMNAVSPKGATSDMQVMPETARQPGFGVVPAKDESLAEKSRVGHDYLNAMVDHYKNPALALVAYNWGPDKTDKWIADGADPSKLPKDVQSYVSKVLSTEGVISQPTIQPQVSASDQIGIPKIQYDKKTKALMAQQLALNPTGFIETYGKQGMEFARQVALEREKARLDDIKRTEFQKDVAIANDPTQPAQVRMAAIAKLNMNNLFKPENIRVAGKGDIQMFPGASAAQLFGLNLPGVPQVNLQGVGQPTPSVEATTQTTPPASSASTQPVVTQQATPTKPTIEQPSKDENVPAGYLNVQGFKIPNPIPVAPSAPSQFGSESTQAMENKQKAEQKIFDLFLSEKGPLQTATTVAQAAGPASQQLDYAIDAAKKMPGGFFAQPKNVIDQILLDVGFADEKQREQVIATKNFEKNIGAVAISKAKALGANPSNEDRKAIMAMFANITDPQEAMLTALYVQKALLQRELLHADYLQQNAHHGYNAEKTFQNWANKTKLSDLVPELKQFEEKESAKPKVSEQSKNIAYDAKGNKVEYVDGKWIYSGSGKEYKP